MTESIERTYAMALLDLADESGRFDDIAEQIRDLGELVDTDVELRALFGSRILSVEDRAQSIRHVFEGRVDDLILRFLLVANDKNRLGLLPGIAKAFAELQNRRHNVAQVDVWTSRDMPDDERDRIAHRLGESLGKTVSLNRHTDPGLIGGLRIRIGDEQVDASVATQLQLIRRKMLDRGREHARTHQDALLSE